MFSCHCRDCQHVSGGAYAPVLYFARKDVVLAGENLSRYTTTSALGKANKRGFCSTCGTRVTHIHVADAQAWDLLSPTTPKYERYPPM